MGVEGAVCCHCRLDDEAMAWELRLFSLTAAARGGARITPEQAVRQAQAAALQRVGRGGLNESGGPQVGHFLLQCPAQVDLHTDRKAKSG